MKKVSVSHKGKTKKIRELKNEADIRKYIAKGEGYSMGIFLTLLRVSVSLHSKHS